MELIRGAPVVTHYLYYAVFCFDSTIQIWQSSRWLESGMERWTEPPPGVQLHLSDTVDGRNPANQLIREISHYVQSFIHVRWLFGISSMSSMAFMMFLISLMSLHFLPELVMNWHTPILQMLQAIWRSMFFQRCVWWCQVFLYLALTLDSGSHFKMVFISGFLDGVDTYFYLCKYLF